ncbi:DEAD-box ATP-dependent RNA helicase 20-like [Pollicipes pollicipes]|uniref:DEAD-box ATP-dependent RNA helicase 20-like n=1 Tax=Pollicipes pollicipes TaxID=41117 RepID=UPI001884A21A|nr:DEAD-box ATP-dependent RNA helicase 20-like [Pollicipes pollicipes]
MRRLLEKKKQRAALETEAAPPPAAAHDSLAVEPEPTPLSAVAAAERPDLTGLLQELAELDSSGSKPLVAGRLRERPTSRAGGAPADSAHLRVLVSCRRRVAPWWWTEQIPFQDMILQKLRPIGFQPSRVQAYLWPALARYRHAVCVSHPGSGKTLGYLLGVVDSLLDRQAYTDLPAGHGPVCLVLVPSWRRARAVHALCQEVADSLRCRPLLVHGGGAEAEQEVALMNGCDLLVGTPSCLLRLLERGGDTYVQLKRVCHLVLDDADLLVEDFTSQVERLVMAVHRVWRTRVQPAAALPEQIVATARHWTDGLRKLTSLLSDPVVDDRLLPGADGVGPAPGVHPRTRRGREGLQAAGSAGERPVPPAAGRVHLERPERAAAGPAAVLPAALTELERCWRSSSGAHDVLIVSDSVCGELVVRDARALLHYDVPTVKRTQLGLRMSYMMDSYAGQADGAEGGGGVASWPRWGDVWASSGNGMFVRVRSRLLTLPEELAAPPPQAVTVHLCGVEPVDGDAEWTDGATQLTREHLVGCTAVGKGTL